MSRNKCVHGYKCALDFCPLEDEGCLGFICDYLEYKTKKKQETKQDEKTTK